MNGLKTLVTGGGGFVGANLIRRLLDTGSTVHALVRPDTDRWRLADVLPRLTLHELDLTNRSGVTKAVRDVDPHVIFHLARHRGNPAALDYRAAYEVNLDSTLSLLEAAAACTRLRRFIHAGSSLEYNLTRSPLSEGDAPAPVTVHGVTKAAAALLCQHFAARHGVPAVVLRLFTIYGPWDGPTRFVPSLMVAALEHRALGLTQPGLRHDWTFIGDVVDACVRAVSTTGIDGEILNVATGTETTNEEVVRLVEELAGHPIGRAVEPFPERLWDTEHWVADMSKTRERLGWQASTSLRAGLERTLTWFRDHRDLDRTRS